jgi:hypothetical protein
MAITAITALGASPPKVAYVATTTLRARGRAEVAEWAAVPIAARDEAEVGHSAETSGPLACCYSPMSRCTAIS